jgi:hypothetical protein
MQTHNLNKMGLQEISDKDQIEIQGGSETGAYGVVRFLCSTWRWPDSQPPVIVPRPYINPFKLR